MGDTIVIDGTNIDADRENMFIKMKRKTDIRESWYYPSYDREEHEKVMEKWEKKIEEYFNVKDSIKQEAKNKMAEKIYDYQKTKGYLWKLTKEGSKIPERLEKVNKIFQKFKFSPVDIFESVRNVETAEDKSKAAAAEFAGYGGGVVGEGIGTIGGGLFFGPPGAAAGAVVGSVIGSSLGSAWMEKSQYEKMKRNLLKHNKKHPNAPSNYYAFGTKKTSYVYGSTRYSNKESPIKILWDRYKKRIERVSKQKKYRTSNNYAYQKLKRNHSLYSVPKRETVKKKSPYERASKAEKRRKKKEVLNYINNFYLAPKIKKHAKGGFVNGKTLSYIGEEGPEVVIPLVSQRRQRGVELWEKTGSKLGVTQGNAFVNQKKKVKKSGQTIDLLQLLKEQRGQVSDELCSILADALEGAYKNIPIVN